MEQQNAVKRKYEPLFYITDTELASQALGERIIDAVRRYGECLISKEYFVGIVFPKGEANSNALLNVLRDFCAGNGLKFRAVGFNVYRFERV